MKSSPNSSMDASSDKDTGAGAFYILQRVFYLALYQVRLIGFWGHVVLPVVAIGAVLLLIREGQPTSYQLFYDAFEVLFPFVSGFFFVPLVLREQEQQTLALIGTTQSPLPFLFILRLLLTVLFQTVLVTILALILQLSPPIPKTFGVLFGPQIERDLSVWPADFLGGPDGVSAVLFTIGAPTLFLAGIGTALAHLTADARVGYLAVFAVWMISRVAGLTLDKHPLFRYIYLFTRSGGTGDWFGPKIVQMALGMSLLFVSGLLLRRLEHFLREP